MIVLDADVLGRNRTGEETYVLNLLRQLPVVAPDLKFAAVTRYPDLVPDGVQVIELPSPPPKMPSAGSPKWPKINDQLINALSRMPAALITRIQPGRSSAERKLRITWNSSQGSIAHI